MKIKKSYWTACCLHSIYSPFSVCLVDTINSIILVLKQPYLLSMDQIHSCRPLLTEKSHWLVGSIGSFWYIDHNILIRRLSSWFGITHTAISGFKSYLLDRNFSVVFWAKIVSISIVIWSSRPGIVDYFFSRPVKMMYFYVMLHKVLGVLFRKLLFYI